MGYLGRQQELDKITAGCNPRGDFHLMPPPALHKSPFWLLFGSFSYAASVICNCLSALLPPLLSLDPISRPLSPRLAVYSVNQPGVSKHCFGRKDAPRRVHLAQTAINMPGVHLQPINARPVRVMKLQCGESLQGQESALPLLFFPQNVERGTV